MTEGWGDKQIKDITNTSVDFLNFAKANIFCWRRNYIDAIISWKKAANFQAHTNNAL